MSHKLLVRNISPDVFAALEAAAIAHDRSTEAEARHALRNWVAPAPAPALPRSNARRTEVAERLGKMLQQLNAPRRGDKLRPSHIAVAIGESKAEDVEDWFLGNQEPAFKRLEAIGRELGIETPWLVHGDGPLFFTKSTRISTDPDEAVKWLMEWDENGEHFTRTVAVYFVRALSEAGELLIVKRSNRRHWRTYITPYHISEQIGSGGEAALMHLFGTWESLYKKRTNGGANFVASSRLARLDVFNRLCHGTENPEVLLELSENEPWWEDIWDVSMQGKHEYWQGFGSLCQRINLALESRRGRNTTSVPA